ncbi:immediate early response gene 2 protein [Hoplias malabaricus]|uniref:immediate early response gene 2 protein n=1 Tax=Hoplias malabaricus TaxID=27720 RepID=UPI003462C9E4
MEAAMDVSAEAKRIMVQALSKMYSCRSQRGGLRLHRSLLLSLVMKSARDAYHSAKIGEKAVESPAEDQEPMDTTSPGETPEATVLTTAPSHTEPPQEPEAEQDQENRTADRPSRKRRGKTAKEPDFLPRKKPKMDSGEVLKILQDATLRTNANSGNCARETDTLPTTPYTALPRTVATC